jgi:hypothetical protein
MKIEYSRSWSSAWWRHFETKSISRIDLKDGPQLIAEYERNYREV